MRVVRKHMANRAQAIGICCAQSGEGRHFRKSFLFEGRKWLMVDLYPEVL